MSSFKVTGRLNLDGSNFQAGMSRAHAAVRGLGGTVASSLKGQLAAAFSIGAVTMLARKTMEYADNIDETASRIGVGAEKLQEWAFAAKQAGSNTEQLAAFVERLTMAALDPSKQALFQRMGIKPEGMTSGGLFESVSAWSRGKSASEVTPILRELTGFKGVGALLNTLQTDLAAAGQAARQAGAVMGTETLQKLAKLNDQFSILSQILVTQFAPALLEAAKLALRAFGQLKGSGGFWGAATQNVGLKDLIGAGANPIKGWMDILDKVEKNIAGGEPGAAFSAETARIDAMISSLEKFSQRTEVQSVIGAPNAAKISAASRYSLPDGNAAMRVGNFLGAGGNQLSSIAQQQLRVQQQQLAVMSQNYREMLRMSEGFARLMEGT